MHFRVGDRADVRQSRGARFHGFDGLDGGFNLSKGPECQRLIRQCPDSRVLPKAKRQVAVARGIKYRERLFVVAFRTGEITGKPFRYAVDPVRDTRLRGMGTLPA